MDEIGAQTFPAQLTSFCVAALFEVEPGDEPIQHYQLTISLDDKLLASFAMVVDFARTRRNRSVNTIQGLSIPAPGTIVMSIVQKAVALADWQLVAIKRGDAPKPAKPPPQPQPQPNEVAAPTTKTGRTMN